MILAKKIFTLLILNFFVISGLVFAQDISYWKDCVLEAQKQNPELGASRQQIQQYRYKRDVTASALYPQIKANSAASTATTEKKAADNYSYDASLNQLIFDGWKTPSLVNQARKELQAWQINYIVLSSKVRYQLRYAFIQVLRARKLITISHNILKRRKQNRDLVLLRYNAGREHKGSLLNAQASLAQAEFDLAKSKRDAILAQRNLNKELGRQIFKIVNVEDPFRVTLIIKGQPDFEGIAVTNPVVQEIAARREAARFAVRAAQGDFLPLLTGQAQIGRTGEHWDPTTDEWSMGLKISLPIFDGGNNYANLSMQEAYYKKIKEDERQKRDVTVYNLVKSWTNFRNAMEEAIVQRKKLRAAMVRSKISEALYLNGYINFDDWTIIESELVAAQKLDVEAKTNTLISEADWLQSKGFTLEEDV